MISANLNIFSNIPLNYFFELAILFFSRQHNCNKKVIRDNAEKTEAKQIIRNIQINFVHKFHEERNVIIRHMEYQAW